MTAADFGIGARLVLMGSDQASALFEENPELLTEATGQAVRAAATAAESLAFRTSGLFAIALEARRRSAQVQEALGHPDEALADHLRGQAILLQVTDDVAGYDEIQHRAEDIAIEAGTRGYDEVFLGAVLLAADAAYWSATEASGDERQERISAAYEWLTRVAPVDPASLDTHELHQLTTLSISLCHLQAGVGPAPAPALASADELLREVFGAAADIDAIVRRTRVRGAAARRAEGRTRLSRLFSAAHGDEVVGAYLADVLGEADQGGAAVLEATELGSARTLLDGLVNRWPQIESDPQVRELSAAITAYDPTPTGDLLRRELALVSTLTFGTSDEDRARRRAAVEALDARAHELGVATGVSGQAAEAPRLQSLLRPDEVLIRYVLPHHPLHPAYLAHAVVVTPTETRLVRLRVPETDGGGMTGAFAVDRQAQVEVSPLGTAVAMARLAAGSALPEGIGDPGHLVDLDEMVLAPVRETGLLDGARHLVVVPQRALHMAPWMAMRSREGRWLIDDASVTLAPSATVWARLRERSVQPVRRAVLVGSVDAAMAGLPDLEGSARQVEAIGLYLALAGVDVRSLTRSRATLEELREAMAGAQLLDISTHGSFPDVDALFNHAFHLTPDLRHDGLVTADQVRTLHLDAASVVLGVCNGGAYRVGPGDEPYGLVPAFLEAGAVNVIAAQWPIDDDLAATFLTQVGMSLPQVGAAEALRLALLECREQAGEGLAARIGMVCVGDGLVPARG